MNGHPRRTEWTSPNVLLVIFGTLMAALGSYQSFKTDSTATIADLKARVAILERHVDRLEERGQ